MRDICLRDDETLEDLQLGGLMLLQKKNGFRFGMDSVLLAHFAAVREADTVADFGSGSGILPLLLIGRGKGKTFYCFEIQNEYCNMSQRTMKMNHLENRVIIRCEDAGNAETFLGSCAVDAVVCNPPYGMPGASIASPFSDRATARNQSEYTLRNFFVSAYRILKGKGKINIIYPAHRMLQVMRLMADCHLEPKRFQLVYPQQTKPANLVLIEGVKDARPMLHPMKPLVIYNGNQDLTNELKSIYHIANEQNSV